MNIKQNLIESVLQSKLDQSSNKQIQQISLTKLLLLLLLLPSPPELQFKQNYQIKDKYSVEQNTTEKNISINIKPNTRIYIQH
jgi:hypothetical protein